MASAHGFFIPDVGCLVGLPGLTIYLGKKIVLRNEYLYCNGRAHEFRPLHVVTKHTINKIHCKLVCETEKDRLKISGFYDFTSYPIASFKSSSRRSTKRGVRTSTAPGEGSSDMGATEDDEWEDKGDENVTVQDGESIYDVESDDEEEILEGTLTYGDSPFELVLPSGTQIGHRSMRRYYKQPSVVPLAPPALDPTRGAGPVHRLLEDKIRPLCLERRFWRLRGGSMTVKPRIEEKQERLDAVFGIRSGRISRPPWESPKALS
ncbi:hypothetical protein BS47DRAFT_84652 [Hydnum rufescens UP504]|uniref:ZN622/Rei1/Reh1 zinc finger C2H2-type domain-containing protein n=1 Tax=Hydnum rufescens UP504 TaxID=1448309 RepID=A0A9P6B7X5_9AGAM|nr:hypothetical protein BS47DRAFT_84652 [Hydnum rufescens UP504]